jgi:hypothetical protein
MSGRNHYILTLAGLLLTTLLFGQVINPGNQSYEKIRGSRFIPYPNHPGYTFLNDKFLKGEIEFNDGSKLKDIVMNYGTYRDELIYYNSTISAQIVIDKISLKGFSFVDQRGNRRVFHRQFYDGSIKDECYFEVLSEGDIELLVYRKVNLEASNTYYSKTGMSYQPSYMYCLYAPEKGYIPVNISRSSLLSKFGKADQKFIKKTLRKNGVIISDEPGFVRAWNVIRENGLQPQFQK